MAVFRTTAPAHFIFQYYCYIYVTCTLLLVHTIYGMGTRYIRMYLIRSREGLRSLKKKTRWSKKGRGLQDGSEGGGGGERIHADVGTYKCATTFIM